LAASGALAAVPAGAALLGACSGDDDGEATAREGEGSTGTTAAPLDPSDWASVRDQFAIDPDLRHFAAFVFASHPRPVREAIERHRRGLDANAESYLLAEEEENEVAVRLAAAEHMGGDPADIALTDSTTMGLGVLYGGLRLAEGDEVLTTEHDFYSTHEALRLRSERTGATVRRVALYDDPAAADPTEMVERLVASVTPATRVVAVTWVHSGTGVKVPVAEVAAALADADTSGDRPPLLCVDGVHGLGAEPDTAADLGCDFLVSGTHKWLFGPRGTGVVWGRPDAWRALDPAIPPFEPSSFTAWIQGGVPTGPAGFRLSPGGYHSAEHRWALAEAFRFHLDIGPAAVADRVRTQATQLKEGLAAIPGVEVVTPADPAASAGIVCASARDADAVEIVAGLRPLGFVASVTPYRERYARFGPSIVTTPDDVDALVEAVATLA